MAFAVFSYSMETSEPSTGKPQRGHRYKKGESGNPFGGRGKDLSQRLDGQEAAMRWVLTHNVDETHEQKAHRLWLRDDRKGFMARWCEIERARSQSQPRGPEDSDTPQDVPDEGEEAVLAILAKLIADFESRQ